MEPSNSTWPCRLTLKNLTSKQMKKNLITYSDILRKGQPETHYSKFRFKQYSSIQNEHLALDLTKILENFFCLNGKGVATNFHNGGDSSVEL